MIDFGKAKDLRFSSYPEYSTNTVSITQFNKCEHQNKGMTSDHSEYPEGNRQHSNTKDNVSSVTATVDSQQPMEEGEDSMVMFVGNVAGDPSSSQHLPYYHCGRTLILLLLLMLF